MINSCTVIASNLLLVDEIMRAGMSSLKVGFIDLCLIEIDR